MPRNSQSGLLRRVDNKQAKRAGTHKIVMLRNDRFYIEYKSGYKVITINNITLYKSLRTTWQHQ